MVFFRKKKDKNPAREEIWGLYRRAGFLNRQKISRLHPIMKEAEKTWDRLLAGGEDLLWLETDRVCGELRSTCVSYRHTLATRVSQHWVSYRNPTGSMKIFIDMIGRYGTSKESTFGRLFFRPANPLAVRLFRSLYEMAPPEFADLTDFEVIPVSSDYPGDDSCRPLTPDEIGQIAPRLRERHGRVVIEAEGLDGPDPLAENVGEIFERHGLFRKRAVFPIRDGNGRILAVLLADTASPGLSLSGFQSQARVLQVERFETGDKILPALRSARRFFSENGAGEFFLMLSPRMAAEIPDDRLERQGIVQMATFDFTKESGDLIERHVRAYYEARLGLAKVVANLSEEEIDWISDNGSRYAFQSGETLIREGEFAESMMLLQSGEVGVFKGKGRKRVQLAICSSPDVIGEIGVLQGVKRTATVVALTPVIALAVSRERLNEFFRIFPEGGATLREALTYRLARDQKKGIEPSRERANP